MDPVARIKFRKVAFSRRISSCESRGRSARPAAARRDRPESRSPRPLARRLDAPKQGRSLPKVLSRDEIDALLAASAARDAAAGLRLVALVEMAYASGLRVSELLGLKVEAIRRDPAYLIVRGQSCGLLEALQRALCSGQ